MLSTQQKSSTSPAFVKSQDVTGDTDDVVQEKYNILLFK